MYCPHGHLDAPSHRYTDTDKQTQIHFCDDNGDGDIVDGGRNDDYGNHDDDGDHE